MNKTETTIQLLTQQRAQFALACVQAAQGSEHAADYARLVRKLPAMILQNGLGQALAFHLADAQGDNHSAAGRAVLDLSRWLIAQKKIYTASSLTLHTMIDALVAGSRDQYMRAQREAMALLDWMKKFADAFIPEA